MRCFRVYVIAVALFVLLTLALMLPTRVAGATFLLFMVVLSVRSRGVVLEPVSDHGCLPTSVRRTVVTECSKVRAQYTARVKQVVSTHCLNELVSSWQFRQSPGLSLSAAA